MDKFIKLLKDNAHFIIALIFLMQVIGGLFKSTNTVTNVTILNQREGDNEGQILKEAICREAMESLRSKRFSDNFIHPEIIRFLNGRKAQDYDLSAVTNLFYKFEGRDVCRVVAKTNEGFIAFHVVVSTDGPLMYRVTSIEPQKPTVSMVKDYL